MKRNIIKKTVGKTITAQKNQKNRKRFCTGIRVGLSMGGL